MATDEALFLPTVPAHEVLDSICAFLPAPEEGISHDDVRRAVILAQAGHAVYIPKHLKSEIRNKEMMQKFTGDNLKQLCHEYRMSRQHFYNILKRYRARKVK